MATSSTFTDSPSAPVEPLDSMLTAAGGALYLFSEDGNTRKLACREDDTIVRSIQRQIDAGVYPLCISEGASEQKLRATRRNADLLIAYDVLTNLEGYLEILVKH